MSAPLETDAAIEVKIVRACARRRKGDRIARIHPADFSDCAKRLSVKVNSEGVVGWFELFTGGGRIRVEADATVPFGTVQLAGAE